MIKKYRSALIVIGILILILVNFLCFWIGYQNFLYPKLGDFEIRGVGEKQEFLAIEVTPCHNAVEYVVQVFKNKEKIYETSSSSTIIMLKDFEAEFNDTLTFQVIAKNKNKEEKKSKYEYIYVYKDPTILKERDHLLSGTRDLTLYVLGLDSNKDTTIELFYEKTQIYEEHVSGEDIVIPYDVVKGYSGRITAYLKNEKKRITSSFNFYLNTPIVGKLHITSPNRESTTRWNDVTIPFSGGENANHFYANLYVNNVLEKRIEVDNYKNSVVIPAQEFEEEKDYQIVLEAVYEDFVEIAEKDSILVHMGKKEATSGVYVSHNPTFIKEGTKVSLNTITKDAVIYYTLDGTIPNTSSSIYKEPLVITSDSVVTTYAVSKNRFDSVVNTYNFKVMEKTPVIYLSPSNQDQNYGVQSAGYTTEMEMMNRLADVVEKYLKNAGFIVYRNSPNGNIDLWTSASRRVNADFHFALHSNASSHHTARGPEIHIDTETSLSYSIASNIYENLWKIYEGNQKDDYHRGIKYARGSLGEANDLVIPCGALIEVAFHDEYNDALWVTKYLEEIGQNLASSIISYYN